ncbi:MAG TPA: hypothetical protein VF773_00895 [Verrucomicrobiae bacterium]
MTIPVIRITAEMVKKLRKGNARQITDEQRAILVKLVLSWDLFPSYPIPRFAREIPATSPFKTMTSRDEVMVEVLASMGDPDPKPESFFAVLKNKEVRLSAAKALAKDLDGAREKLREEIAVLEGRDN